MGQVTDCIRPPAPGDDVVVLTGNRVQLRAWRDEDIGFFHQLRNDVDTQIALMAEPRPTTYAATREWLEARSRDRDGHFFVVGAPATREPVGFVELRATTLLHRHASLGICLAASFRGQGLASEALDLVHRHAERLLGLRKIMLQVIKSHAQAVQLYERLGYEVAGVLREHFYFAGQFHDVLLMEKFLPQHSNDRLPWMQ